MNRQRAEQIERRIGELLGTSRLGRPLTVLPTVDSTMEFARRRLAEGAAKGSAVLALEQSKGCGRRGRSFVSPPGGLYLTLLLDPLEPAELSWRAGFAAALAASRTIQALGGPQISFDWPNDLVLEGSGKVGGVLLDLLTPPGDEPSLLLGIGLNLGPDPRAVDPANAGPAAAIPPLPVAEPLSRVAAGLLSALESLLAGLGGAARWREVLDAVRELSLAARLRRIRIRRPDGTVVEGIGEGIGEDGSLLLRTSDQRLIAVRYGERDR